MRQIYLVNIVTFFSFLNLGAQTSEIDITSSLDNTIFKDLLLSNGAGPYIFTGTTNKGVTRRALVQFDLTDVPAGTLVDSVVLTLKLSN